VQVVAYQLHRVLHDGSVAHAEFTRTAWEAAMRDPNLARFWGHGEDDCFDPLDCVPKSGKETPLVQERIVPPSTREILSGRKKPKLPEQVPLFDPEN
jgi:hypothetical protein